MDAAILPGMRVDVHAPNSFEPLRGVVGRKPIHLIEPDERKNVTPIDKLVIDLGMPAKRVKKLVMVGDVITFGVGFERFGKNMAVSVSYTHLDVYKRQHLRRRNCSKSLNASRIVSTACSVMTILQHVWQIATSRFAS